MIGLALLVTLSGGELISDRCSEPPKAAYRVMLEVQPVNVASSLTLADISGFAAVNRAAPPHPVYGFYVGTFGYTVSVSLPQRTAAACPGRAEVDVTLMINRRRIEIAREIVRNRCLYTAYVGHYQKHAADDVAVIAKYRDDVERTLQSASEKLPAVTSASRAEVTQMVKDLVETQLKPLDMDRKAAAARVDSSEELERLNGACEGHT